MGDRSTLAKARQELEDLYRGVPDESVDLTFKDMVSFQQSDQPEKKGSQVLELIHEEQKRGSEASGKAPSADSSPTGLKDTRGHLDHHLNGEVYRELVVRSSFKRNTTKGPRSMVEDSYVSDDVCGYNIASRSPYEDRAVGRRRPGIPHSNICTVCSVYTYVFRHRCLVCGRAYCRQCVGKGMGEMTEGRKCIECLGMRFSQRYIRRAEKVGCCCYSRYPTSVKLQELKWAEKGPRRSGEREYGRSCALSKSRSLARPGTPTRVHVSTSQASFEMSRTRSPVSPRSPTRSPHACDRELASFATSTARAPTIYAAPF